MGIAHQDFSIGALADNARASMDRVLRGLTFEDHPVVNRSVCVIVCEDGDVIHFDKAEIELAATAALTEVIKREASRNRRTASSSLEQTCRECLTRYAASHVPETWSQ